MCSNYLFATSRFHKVFKPKTHIQIMPSLFKNYLAITICLSSLLTCVWHNNNLTTILCLCLKCCSLWKCCMPKPEPTCAARIKGRNTHVRVNKSVLLPQIRGVNYAMHILIPKSC